MRVNQCAGSGCRILGVARRLDLEFRSLPNSCTSSGASSVRCFCRRGSRDADACDMRPRDRHRPRLILRIGLQSSLGVCEAARVVQHDGRGFAMMLKN